MHMYFPESIHPIHQTHPRMTDRGPNKEKLEKYDIFCFLQWFSTKWNFEFLSIILKLITHSKFRQGQTCSWDSGDWNDQRKMGGEENFQNLLVWNTPVGYPIPDFQNASWSPRKFPYGVPMPGWSAGIRWAPIVLGASTPRTQKIFFLPSLVIFIVAKSVIY